MNKIAAADIVIFGGGIAGLWLLNRLRQTGLSTILFESGALGGGQTNKAQGIIHGGMKYALQGLFTKDAQAVSDMPALWQNCLSGKGELDLKEVTVLSKKHYLWSPHKFTSKLTGFLAGATLKSKVLALSHEEFPNVFQHAAFKGEVFALDEFVIDVPALVRELVKANQDAIFKIEPLNDEELKFDDDGQLLSATVYLSGKSVEVTAQQFVFAAGSGNDIFIKKMKNANLAMQRRPLHMVLVKTPFQHPLYAHCLGLGARPRMTITTHYLQDGSFVWYLGGQLAEDGIDKNETEQIKIAKKELENLFPWLSFQDAEFSSFFVDRAEPQQKSGIKPESCFLKSVQNMMIIWPTKLALAPKLAAEVLQKIAEKKLSPQLFNTRELRSWPMPPLATPIWEEAFCKSIA